MLFVLMGYFTWVLKRNSGSNSATTSMPNHLPRGTPVKRDPINRLPGQQQGGAPSGDVFLGVEKSSNKQVWFRFKDWLRHALVTGTTGSGKTELLISIAYNFLSAGGNGLMFADPKADHKVAFKLAWIAKRFGREDDLLICNYVTPKQNASSEQHETTSNTCNPLQLGTGKEVASMLMSLIPKNDGGSNAVFADNAVTLTQVLSKCLVALRDQGVLELSWGTFRQFLTLESCIGLAKEPALPDKLQQEMALFVYGIAGVDKQKSFAQQSNIALEQFGYIASYCQRGLATLTGTYGYIYDCQYGDFSYQDVVKRRRILLSILPSLQNTQDEIKMLGKIDLFGKKQALSQNLVGGIEGRLADIQRKQAQHNGVPSLNIMDEYKYISVPGMSVAATQGRSLGWASVVGVQSYAGLTVDGEQEADEWIENTSTKFIGSAQGESTFTKMDQVVGKEFVARSEGRTQNSQLPWGSHEKIDAKYEQLSVLDIRDMRAQIEGEFTLIVSDREIRMQTLFVRTPLDDNSADSNAGIVINSFMDLPPFPPQSAEVTKARDSFFSQLFDGSFNS